MAITRERKEDLLAQYQQWVQESRALFLADYSGIPVKEMEQLRAEVRKAGGIFSITKNTLLKIALEQSGTALPDEFLTGQLASGFALEEAPALAKTLVDFAKAQEQFTLRGGVLGQKLLTAEQVEALAKLPSLEELRAQLLGVISAPARNMAATVAAGVRQVINVLDAYARKEEEAAEAAA